jgi:alkanesulfonate monooxygenase
VSFKGAYYEIEEALVRTPFLSTERTGPEIYLGGSSDAALELATRQADCLWTLPRRPEEMALRLQAVLESGVEVGVLMSIIARRTRAEALAAAQALIGRFGGDARRVHREFSERSDSVAFTGTLALAEESGGEWLTPSLWTGAVPYLGAPAIAFVGSYDEVAAAIGEFAEVGISQFLFMGWPDLEEMERFAHEVRPRLATAACAPAPLSR